MCDTLIMYNKQGAKLEKKLEKTQLIVTYIFSRSPHRQEVETPLLLALKCQV